MNILIFTNFLLQSKINVKEDNKYKQANEILGRCKPKEYKPKSPAQYMTKVYTTKGLTLIITTIASLFAIGNAILNYDYMLLIATVFTVILAIVFGVMAMKKAELYYSEEYYDYAKNEENKILDEERKLKEEIEPCLQLTINNSET